MPIFNYECKLCEHQWEVLVISQQTGFEEPTECPVCQDKEIVKVISAPAVISMGGKAALRTVPDPHPPLQELKAKGPKEGCEGGYADLPEFKPTERVKTKEGNWEWREKKRQFHDLGKK